MDRLCIDGIICRNVDSGVKIDEEDGDDVCSERRAAAQDGLGVASRKASKLHSHPRVSHLCKTPGGQHVQCIDGTRPC